MYREGKLNGKVCLVTGSGKGIGKAVAERLASEDAIVYANARTQGCLEDWSVKLSEEYHTSVYPLYFDVTDFAGVKKSILKIKKAYGRIDVLVNNAGMVTNDLLGMISVEKARKMFDVNVFGLLEISQLVATKFMMKQKSGSIINMASIVGVEGSRGQAAYSASKGAVIALTKSMSKEMAPYNVRVNAVAPGMIETERLKVTIKEEYKDNFPPIGMGRLGTVQEVADACLYFASPLSSYTTGQILVLGGGYSTLSRTLFNIEFLE